MSDDLSFSDIPTSSLSEDQLRDLMSLCSGIGPSYLSALKKTHGVIVANLRSPEGFVAYIDLPEKDSIYISLICSKKVKGGLGKRLLEHIEGKGRSKILACVVEQAIGFYLRMGFVFSKSISDFPNRYEMDERDEDFFPEDDWFFGSIVETDDSVEVNCVAMEKHLAK